MARYVVATGVSDEVAPGVAGRRGAAARARVYALAWRVVPLLAIVGLIFVAFMPALDAGLVNWDDDDLLLHNTRHHTLDADTLWWMFTTSFAGHFQPLTWLSYWLDWQIWRRETFGFHLTNLILHALTALGLYFLTRRLIAVGVRDPSAVRSKTVIAASAVAAMLFAVHPLRVESVAWLAERRDVLSGVFYVLAVLCYVRYAARGDGLITPGRAAASTVGPGGGSSGGRWGWYAGAVLFCGVSLLAKASAVTLPLVLLVLDVYPLRRLGRVGVALGERVRRAGWLIVEKVPLLGVAALASWRALAAQEAGGALEPLSQHGVAARLAQACYGLVFYLWKTVLPFDLGPLYEIPADEVLFGTMLRVSVVVLLAMVMFLLRFWRRVPALSAALAAYVVILFPVLGFFQSGPQLVADRYSYLACMGLAVAAGAGIVWLGRRTGWLRQTDKRALISLVLMVLIAVLSQRTYAQAEKWLSAHQLWRHGVMISPDSAIAHTNYADALARSQLFGAGAAHYRKALALDPHDPVALHHYADLLVRFGMKREAIPLYVRALQVDPDRKRACFSLARLLVEAGRVHEALPVLRDGIRRHPDALDMIDYLAQLLATHPDASVRDGAEAVRLAERLRATESDVQRPYYLLTLATAYAEAGQFDRAVRTAERVLALADPEYDERLIHETRRRLSLFRDGQPFHYGE